MEPSANVTTEAEEMYLITVARAIEDGVEPPIPVSTIAAELDTSVVSANQMIRKLESGGFVNYLPYKGVALTDDGRAKANAVLRNRRLWGVFLTDHLGLPRRRLHRPLPLEPIHRFPPANIDNSAGPADETLAFGVLDGYPVAGACGLERSD